MSMIDKSTRMKSLVWLCVQDGDVSDFTWRYVFVFVFEVEILLSSSFMKIVKTLKPIVDCTGNPRKIEVYVVFSQTLTKAARLKPSK